MLNGFLPVQDPLKKLPQPFHVWEKLADSLPKLLVSRYLRETIEKMPVLNPQALVSEMELERAMMLLSFIGHAYVWGEKKTAKKIPITLALPWCEVAEKLHRPAVLSYNSYALQNWQRIDVNKPIELGNITLLQNFFGGLDEEWFVLVHVDIEQKASPAISVLPELQLACKENDSKMVLSHLKTVEKSLINMCDTLDRMPQGCDPYIYYNRVRPYIHGWKDNPALPRGIIYEGVEKYKNKPQKFRGETGAQSAIIPSLDAVFGIQHENDPLREYLMEMRDYMPLLHREFLMQLEKAECTVRQYVLESKNKLQQIREYYNRCIELIFRFRSTHLHYAATYIHKQHQTSLANPTARGTGGTPFMIYLRKHKEETKKFLL